MEQSFRFYKKKCVDEIAIDPSEKRAIIRIVVDYMINTLHTTKRNVAAKIAKAICDKYPKSLTDSLNYDESWGCGFQSLFVQIYNAVLYKSVKDKSPKSSGTKRSLQGNNDSDDEAQLQRGKELESKRKQDEYRCVNYAPLLTNDETPESQEEARVKLIELFSSGKNNSDVCSLMNKTYPTLRATIKDLSVDLQLIPENWPFLQMVEYFLDHSSHLLAIDITKIWTQSIEKRMKVTEQYFKSLKLKKQMKSKIDNLVTDA